MRTLHIENVEILADMMLKNMDDEMDCFAVLFYEDAVKLTSILLSTENVKPVALDIAQPDFEGYHDVYYVDLTAPWGEEAYELYVSKAKDDNGEYLYNTAHIAYVDEEANSSILKNLETEELYQLHMGNQCDGDDDCSMCDYDYDECPFTDFDEEDQAEDILGEEMDCQIEGEDFFKPLLDFIFDVIGDLCDYIKSRERFTSDEIIDFITRRFGPYDEDSEWMRCNCYYFATILNERFPGGHIYYDVVVGHFVYEYDGLYYDYSGLIEPTDDLVEWEKFDEYDSYQKERIIRDCIK